ncbi:hypothetical protein [Bacteroides cellulosilyticus]|uniref:hypothetical protein n=1 Tax=Bacteroides cellulosilyticus TaxID=246787 RepID=UPI0022E12E33|nr:hypothetical protein [Bacteroides cellulosilyticus]
MKFNIIDTHYHASSRSANDYESLAIFGIKTIIEPSHRFCQRIDSVAKYLELLNKQVKNESLRANAFGVKYFFGIGLMPCDFISNEVYQETLAYISSPQLYSHDKMCCYGEVELDIYNKRGEDLFVKQLEYYSKNNYPIIVNIPHINREHVFKSTFSLLEKNRSNHKISFHNIVMDGIYIDEVECADKFKFKAIGIPISLRNDAPFVVYKKNYPEQIMSFLKSKKYDFNKIIFNSAIGFGYGIPSGLSQIAGILQHNEISNEIINKTFYLNAQSTFNL